MESLIFGLLLLAPSLYQLIHFLLTPHDIETTIQKTRKVIGKMGKSFVGVVLVLVVLFFLLSNYYQIYNFLAQTLSYKVVSFIGNVVETISGATSVLAVLRCLFGVVINLIFVSLIPFFACLCFVQALDIAISKRYTFEEKVQQNIYTSSNYSSTTGFRQKLFLELKHFLS